MLKPVLFVPAAICIAVDNNRIGSAVTGAVCGFLIDISCGKLFGCNAVLLTFFCILVSLVFELYLRNRFLNIFIICAAVSFIQGVLDYKLYYEMWDYEDVELIFRNLTVPVWILTVISSVFVYMIIRLINKLLMPKQHLSLEEAFRTNRRSG
jgi:rod shape-determining protein MreD